MKIVRNETSAPLTAPKPRRSLSDADGALCSPARHRRGADGARLGAGRASFFNDCFSRWPGRMSRRISLPPDIAAAKTQMPGAWPGMTNSAYRSWERVLVERP